MAVPDASAVLRGLPLFAALDADAIARLAAASRSRTLAAGERLFREGEPARGLFAVTAGCVKLSRLSPEGREQVLHRVRPGQTFAEAAALTLRRYPADAAAAEDGTEVIEVGADAFRRVVEDDPRAAKAIVASLCAWLQRLVGRVEELTVLSAGARLARYVLDLPATGGAREQAVELPLTKKDVAAHLGVTPETLSRLLRRWQDRGIVRSEGGTIVVLDAGALLAIAEDAAG